ncbi:BON domain-containing protein [Rhizobium sp. BK376]|uniref:BON domain-containing protein n=1 Tax=Rhizobium sp. BK376 TaxID=2512149 RepID=UPI001042EEBE|nr:BON domain-containing protein [Rhizobium sp. BK376]TCR76651.1 osmotically-inducible protein OsmY [Rhizobium sp. BK376]
MNDLQIRQDVLDELEFDPRIDAANIGVSVDDGIVTLSGHVKNYADKLAAETAAQRVKGVRAIAEEIEVRLPAQKKRADDEIAARALDIIAWDTALPEGAIEVKVQKGWVTLSGEVRWHFQRMAAQNAVQKLSGVSGVINLLTIRPQPTAADVKGKIEQALRRRAESELDGIEIDVADKTVVLKGGVRTWSEKALAEQAAWSVPGVSVVDSHLQII